MTPAEKILKALKEREWGGLIAIVGYKDRASGYTWGCISCNRIEHDGHTADCTYAEAIREAEKMVRDQGCTETV